MMPRLRQLIPITLISLPPVIGCVAAIWPLERFLLCMVCLPLLIVSLTLIVASRSIQRYLLGIAAVAVLLSTFLFDMPLQTVFHFSRPTFDRIAGDVASGTAIKTPFWIGPLRICKVEQHRSGVVCLWTDDAPAGHTGFVQHGPTELPFNLWSHVAIADSWQFISED
ncbi:hypothetical protein SH528x_002991 [Novipirellula sp. SH528]|uniref:hypothetical protein n=1 Tax=Novipirellula sp. SH528 TaxID=3454466 RepID=UPI003F9F5D85